jgi:hypothetical protein
VQDDIKTLEDLNVQIRVAENQGDRDWLAGVIAPKLAFQRANPERTISDRNEFLDAVKAGAQGETEVESISLYGNRAVVTCIVTLKTDGGDRRFHNVRLWVRSEGGWKLLGWANEPL